MSDENRAPGFDSEFGEGVLSYHITVRVESVAY